jgi:hypothetical protein
MAEEEVGPADPSRILSLSSSDGRGAAARSGAGADSTANCVVEDTAPLSLAREKALVGCSGESVVLSAAVATEAESACSLEGLQPRIRFLRSSNDVGIAEVKAEPDKELTSEMEGINDGLFCGVTFLGFAFEVVGSSFGVEAWVVSGAALKVFRRFLYSSTVSFLTRFGGSGISFTGKFVGRAKSLGEDSIKATPNRRNMALMP